MKPKTIIISSMVIIIALTVGICFAIGGGIINPLNHHIKLAVKYLNEGNYTEAILQFDKAIAIDSKSTELYFAKANAEILAGNTEDSYSSITTALQLLKDGTAETNSNKVLASLLTSEDYRSEEGLMLYWYTYASNQEELIGLVQWFKDYLGEEYILELMEADSKAKAEEGLASLLDSKILLQNQQGTRKILKDPYEEPYTEPVLEDYKLDDGILSYRVADLDGDHNYEILTIEVLDNILQLIIYQVGEDGINIADTRELGYSIPPSYFGGNIWRKIFLHEYNGEYLIFDEALYSYWFGEYYEGISGYRFASNQLTEIINEDSDDKRGDEFVHWEEQLTAKLESFGLYFDYNFDYNEEYLKLNYLKGNISVAENNHADVLVTTKQIFNGDSMDLVPGTMVDISVTTNR